MTGDRRSARPLHGLLSHLGTGRRVWHDQIIHDTRSDHFGAQHSLNEVVQLGAALANGSENDVAPMSSHLPHGAAGRIKAAIGARSHILRAQGRVGMPYRQAFGDIFIWKIERDVDRRIQQAWIGSEARRRLPRNQIAAATAPRPDYLKEGNAGDRRGCARCNEDTFSKGVELDDIEGRRRAGKRGKESRQRSGQDGIILEHKAKRRDTCSDTLERLDVAEGARKLGRRQEMRRTLVAIALQHLRRNVGRLDCTNSGRLQA